MRRLDERELARLLRLRAAAQPPERLAQRIKSEIPERIAVGEGALRPHPDREHAVVYRQIVLLCALLAAAIAAALWGLKAMLAAHERDVQHAALERLLAGAAATGRADLSWLDAAVQPSAALPVRVDPASFALARALLAAGRLPAPELVLAGSFVNAFDYGDPAPFKGALAIYAEGAVSPTDANRRVVRIALRAADAAGSPALATTPIAYDATAKIAVDPAAVARYRFLAEAPSGERSGEAGFGDDLFPGHRVTILLEIELCPGATLESRVATVSAAWRRPSGAAGTADHVILARDLATRWDEAPSSLRLAALAADLAHALARRPAPDAAALARISRSAGTLAARFPNDREIRELARFAAQAEAFARR